MTTADKPGKGRHKLTNDISDEPGRSGSCITNISRITCIHPPAVPNKYIYFCKIPYVFTGGKLLDEILFKPNKIIKIHFTGEDQCFNGGLIYLGGIYVYKMLKHLF